MTCEVCLKPDTVTTARVVSYQHKCRYHKCPSRLYYNSKQMAPEGMCPTLFHAAYPACLRVLYGGVSKISVRCPNPNGSVLVLVYRHGSFAGMFKMVLKWFVELFGKHIEIHPDDIGMSITFVNADAGCMYHKAGERFFMNTWLGREMCPAEMDAVYPVVHAMQEDAALFVGAVVCPDSGSNVKLELKR